MTKLKPARTFARDAGGAAIIEFAFIFPVMLLVLALTTVFGQALAIGGKVTLTARTIVDIVSRNTQLSTSDLKTILDASAFTMAPYDSSGLAMMVAEIQTDASGAATVIWSKGDFKGTALAAGSSFPLPAAMAIANATYIYGQVSYAFSPVSLGLPLSQPITLSDVAYFSPRVSATVAYPSPN